MAVHHLQFTTIKPQNPKTGQKSFRGFLYASGANFHQESQEVYKELVLQPGKVSNPKASKAEQIIIQVKGGKTGVKDVRGLRGVLDREKLAMGVLIPVQPPTRDMLAEALSADFYEHKPIQEVTHCTTSIYILFSGSLFFRKRPSTAPATLPSTSTCRSQEKV